MDINNWPKYVTIRRYFYTSDQKLRTHPDEDCHQPGAPVNAVQRARNANRNKTLNLKLVYTLMYSVSGPSLIWSQRF